MMKESTEDHGHMQMRNVFTSGSGGGRPWYVSLLLTAISNYIAWKLACDTSRP